MGSFMKTSAVLATLLSAAINAGMARGADSDADAAARNLLADRWFNDARTVARNSDIPPELVRQHLLILLATARALAPDSLEILQATADAAQDTRDREILKDALKAIVKTDPRDYVAQVRLITAIAEGAQAIEEQLRILANAAEKEDLDPQVRSELALKLAKLFMQRSDLASARKWADRATDLNDFNAAAWELKMSVQTGVPTKVSERMAAIVKCLLANPYQPAVWFTGGRALAATNQHDLAADFLAVGIDGAQRSGAGVPTNVALEWALESAIADRRQDAEPLLRKISVLDDTPVDALVTALSVLGPSLTTTAPAEDPLLKRIHDKLAAAVKAAPQDKAVLADAAWIEVFYMPAPGPEATTYLDQLKALVGEKDATYIRIRGWQSLREGKLAEATLFLAPLATGDSLAQLGLARIAASSGNLKAAGAQLQELWNTHPTGMLALHVAAEARKNKIILKDTALGQSVRTAASSLPQSAFTAASQPRDVMLILPTLSKPQFAFGEPITLSVKVINTTDHPLAAGPGGAIKSSLALAGAMRGASAQTIGVYAMSNEPHVYRLPPRGSVIQNIRVDQGIVYEAFANNPAKNLTISLTLMTDPRPTPQGLLPGLGGQIIPAGEFLREAAPIGKMDDVLRLTVDLPSQGANRQMLGGLMLLQLLPELADPKAPDVAKAARARIIGAMQKLIASESPVVSTWFVRVTPLAGMPEEIETALARAGQGREPAQRMAWYTRLYAQSRQTKEGVDALRDRLKEAADKEADSTAKEFASILYREAMLPPPPAATTSAPATAPAAAPTAGPALAPAADPAK